MKLTKPQFDKLSDLCLGLGQIFFGTTVVPYILPTIDKPPASVLVFGVVGATGFWMFAIWIVRGNK